MLSPSHVPPSTYKLTFLRLLIDLGKSYSPQPCSPQPCSPPAMLSLAMLSPSTYILTFLRLLVDLGKSYSLKFVCTWSIPWISRNRCLPGTGLAYSWFNCKVFTLADLGKTVEYSLVKLFGLPLSDLGKTFEYSLLKCICLSLSDLGTTVEYSLRVVLGWSVILLFNGFRFLSPFALIEPRSHDTFLFRSIMSPLWTFPFWCLCDFGKTVAYSSNAVLVWFVVAQDVALSLIDFGKTLLYSSATFNFVILFSGKST